MQLRPIILALCVALWTSGKVFAERPAAKPVDFARDVQPILAGHCYACHGPKRQESSYRLDVRSVALGEADFGDRPIVPGKSAESPLVDYVSRTGDVVMPPEGKGRPLSAAQISLLRAWIDGGARWPDELAGDATKLTTDHWSFQSAAQPRPPAIDEAWIAGPIDAFVFARLKTAGLAPSPQADRVTLIRRIYLDMLGLPPSPEAVAEFVSDERPGAYERLVERVLAAPGYGERWARHWLDVVRFAETNGFETNRERPGAYHYRDYVITALNEDRPYDRFVKEQIAGDAFDADAATGFLVAGPYDVVKSPDINLTLAQRQDELADIINTTGTAFLGLTLGCARCHSHKFDPVSQRDYYALQAVFAGVMHGERSLGRPNDPAVAEEVVALEGRLNQVRGALARFEPLARVKPAPDEPPRRRAVDFAGNVDRFAPRQAKYVRFTVLATSNVEPCLDEIEILTSADQPRNVALASGGAKATASSLLPGHKIHQVAHVNDGRAGNEHSWISNEPGGGWIQIELPETVEIERIAWARDRNGRYRDRLPTKYRIEVAVEPDAWQVVATSADRRPFQTNVPSGPVYSAAGLPADAAATLDGLLKQQASLTKQLAALRQQLNPPTAYAGVFQQPGTTHRLYRGDPMAKREAVAPDTLAVIGSLGLAQDAAEQQRRVKLARWIADAENPLTARVLVNRLWHYHFGTGLVSTPSDFGAAGTPPSHPKLLDWLAGELVGSGWSIKHVQRLILTSATYRQSSQPRKEALARDAGCRLLWRFPPRRLAAEAIRDSALAVTGALDRRVGGPGFLAFDVVQENVRHYFPKAKFGPAEWRRMIYMTKVRQEQDAVFGAFDCPDGNQTVARRSRSTTPLQALNLLNSAFMLQQAELFAERLEREAGDDAQAQVRRAFLLTLGRAPDQSELADSLRLAEEHGTKMLCRALLNSNEFLFLP